MAAAQNGQTQQVIDSIYGEMQDGLLYEEPDQHQQQEDYKKQNDEVSNKQNENCNPGEINKIDEQMSCSQFVRAVLANNVTIKTPNKTKKIIVMTPELRQRVCFSCSNSDSN